MPLQITTSTELRQHYAALKGQYPESLLLFSMPNGLCFYEQDAIDVSRKCGLTLRCSESILWVTFPDHHMDDYVSRLINNGREVILCVPEGVKILEGDNHVSR